MRSDSEIKRDVEDELRFDPVLDPSDIAISVKNGVVTLTGFVKHYADKFEAEQAAKRAMEHGVRKVDVMVKGPGSGRETAIRSLQNTGIEVTGIKDVTPVPHNGCRPPKRRRV